MAGPRMRVLIVEDDVSVGRVIAGILSQASIDTQRVTSGDAALEAVATQPFDAVITDLRMPGMDGMALLERLLVQCPGVPVVMITAHASVPLAVEAMKRGAADFVSKPFDRDEFLFVVRKVLTGRSEAPPPHPAPAHGEGMLIGTSAAMAECAAMIDRVAPSRASVLLRGESGVGKELAARSLHARGGRRDGPFVAIQCGALPESLLEAELFGYEKGAFTGATNRKPGRIELADGGTLFLDEIGDVSPAIQVKLLRVLQEREVQHLGGTQPISVDVRVVAATHRDLAAMVRAGEFREDLFFRLNVVPIWLPPLRARPEDVAPLARHFCALLGAANGRPRAALTDAALAVLAAQRWPGNVRELQNFVERLVVLAEADAIDAPYVERELRRGPLASPAEPDATNEATAGDPSAPAAHDAPLAERVRVAERDALAQALARAGNNRTVAARILGVSRRKLYNLLEQHKVP